MCDAIRIAHPQIASDAKKFFFASDAKTHSLDLKSQENARKTFCENPAMSIGLRCEKSGCFLRSSDAKCLRFGLPLRFGLRCERPRCQIASDSGRAMRATKGVTVIGAFPLLNGPFSNLNHRPVSLNGHLGNSEIGGCKEIR